MRAGLQSAPGGNQTETNETYNIVALNETSSIKKNLALGLHYYCIIITLSTPFSSSIVDY